VKPHIQEASKAVGLNSLLQRANAPAFSDDCNVPIAILCDDDPIVPPVVTGVPKPACKGRPYFFQGANGNDKPDNRTIRSLASTPSGNPVVTYASIAYALNAFQLLFAFIMLPSLR
jgi:hypothetical protein